MPDKDGDCYFTLSPLGGGNSKTVDLFSLCKIIKTMASFYGYIESKANLTGPIVGFLC